MSSSSLTQESIQALLAEHIEQLQEIRVGYDGNKAHIIVVSPIYASMSRIKKQQSVYGVLQPHIADGSIHAVTMETLTPEEWESVKHFR